jgi:YidC/Oxa1 family membrane protein insertase
MLAFVEFPGLDRNTRFELVSQSANEVVYRAVLDGRIEVTRRYVIAPDQVGATDPYQLRSETTFRNIAAQACPAMRVTLAVGTAAPTSLLDNGFQLATGYSNGTGQTFVRRAQLEASGGFLGLVGARGAIPLIEAPGPVVWAATKNQFFTSILTPDQPGAGFVTRRVKLLDLLPDDVRNAYGIAGDAQFDIPALAPGGRTTLGADFYVGPTEYHRLANSDVFKADQDKVMQFGKYIGFFAAILLTCMTKIHSFVPNWGLAIVCTTLTLRFAMLAFTIPAARSSRRMQKIQPLLKAMREKYKDNPQKQQAATLELFKEHKVNPIGGCLPMLFTMPFFFGFFRMLQSAVELRFAPFLWAHDLSTPDTVFAIGHGMIPFIGTFKLNILPLLFTATSMVQMRLVPQPSVDNAQMKMMKFMPLMLLFIYYPYSCALSLYSTTNGLFMIGQQLLVNRMRDDGDPTHAKAGDKSLKNVTPKKKR